jgi:hypothetical protein
MDRLSEQRSVLIVLRVVGILTVLIGLMLTTHTILQLMAVNSVMRNPPRGMNVNIKGLLGSIRGWAVVAQLSIVVWGVALYKLASWLSETIVGIATAENERT